MSTFHAHRRAIMLAASMFVLSGCATTSGPVSVADTIASAPELSTLSSLIVKAGLTDTLKGTGPFTVFAPSNAAFAKVPAKTMDDLAQHPEKLKAVLTYHVIPARSWRAMSKTAMPKPSMVPIWPCPKQATS
jgi:uncharacterized surface protein with fasciclin (FAS1) repeats